MVGLEPTISGEQALMGEILGPVPRKTQWKPAYFFTKRSSFP
jgi:hypothetical protein